MSVPFIIDYREIACSVRHFLRALSIAQRLHVVDVQPDKRWSRESDRCRNTKRSARGVSPQEHRAVCVAPRQYTGTQQCIIIIINAEAVVLIGCIGFYCICTVEKGGEHAVFSNYLPPVINKISSSIVIFNFLYSLQATSLCTCYLPGLSRHCIRDEPPAVYISIFICRQKSNSAYEALLYCFQPSCHLYKTTILRLSSQCWLANYIQSISLC